MQTQTSVTLIKTGVDRLSCWYPSDFTVRGRTFNSLKQFEVFCMAVLAADHEIAKIVMDTRSPRKLADLADLIQGLDEEEWATRRESLMAQGCYARFSQNDRDRIELLETNGTRLIEAGELDMVWSVGVIADGRHVSDQNHWRGQGLIGPILESVRARLAAEAALAQRYA